MSAIFGPSRAHVRFTKIPCPAVIYYYLILQKLQLRCAYLEKGITEKQKLPPWQYYHTEG